MATPEPEPAPEITKSVRGRGRKAVVEIPVIETPVIETPVIVETIKPKRGRGAKVISLENPAPIEEPEPVVEEKLAEAPVEETKKGRGKRAAAKPEVAEVQEEPVVKKGRGKKALEPVVEDSVVEEPVEDLAKAVAPRRGRAKKVDTPVVVEEPVKKSTRTRRN